ncbi:hypothetical protein BJ165DRAFT_1342583 [Panaeolus papilionaceus]|nr:hypothetical protein BJ165DRAFT_1342583 [Panaeolus papilionaceus]
MKALNDHSPHLKRPFARSVFACAGFNVGPKVATLMHRDCMNCPYGWCSVQALGHFDYKKGGHMVFEDLKIAIEFPPGSLILLPSATLKHGNTSIGEEEERASLTQFTPGNLFRYIECGFQTEGSLKEMDRGRYDELMTEKARRWKKGVKLWSTVNKLMTGSSEAEHYLV